MPKAATPKKAPTLSPTHAPEDLSLEEWQRGLRQQHGRKQQFQLRNLGDDPVFSEFSVFNPVSKSTYRVTLRGPGPGENHCTCPDYRTNTLGTCKHIEAVVGRIEKRPALLRRWKAGHRPVSSEVVLHYGADRSIRFRPGSDCPKALAAAAQFYFGTDGVWNDSSDSLDGLVTVAETLDHELRIGDDVQAHLARQRDDEVRRAALAAAFPKGAKSAAFKSLLKVPLYEYQREGALFAARAGRALIADEMGLGKTIQALAAAEMLAQHSGVERVLIIGPTSLKHQWKREIEKFSGRSAEVLQGNHVQRGNRYRSSTAFFLITNYDVVHHDRDSIAHWSPDLVILDEAQRIKNWSTRVARSVKRIESPCAIVLTGTPLENRLEELVSIVQFVDQHRLGPTFKLQQAHQTRDDHGKVVGYRDLDKLGATLAPILIRRRKDAVLAELPERIDSTVFVPMTSQQMTLHEEARDLVAMIVAKWRRFRYLSDTDKRKLMAHLQTMRMSCDSSYLVEPSSEHGPKPDEIITVARELIETEGTKVVIFSQWLRMHVLLAKRLKHLKCGHVLFHGGVPGAKRGELVDTFRTDPACKVFLATDAGGVGLNLQHAAAAVINADLPWNPAVLEQRIGRVHRLGQTRAVRVFNFVAKGTIEESMLGVIGFKKSLFAGVLDGGAKDIAFGGTKLTKFMESVEKATAPVAAEEREIVEEASRMSEEPKPEAGPASPLAELLALGESFTQSLSAGTSPLVRTDAATGRSYLHLPMPEPKVLEHLISGLTGFLRALGTPAGSR